MAPGGRYGRFDLLKAPPCGTGIIGAPTRNIKPQDAVRIGERRCYWRVDNILFSELPGNLNTVEQRLVFCGPFISVGCGAPWPEAVLVASPEKFGHLRVAGEGNKDFVASHLQNLKTCGFDVLRRDLAVTFQHQHQLRLHAEDFDSPLLRRDNAHRLFSYLTRVMAAVPVYRCAAEAALTLESHAGGDRFC
jgi:hypothetical protein